MVLLVIAALGPAKWQPNCRGLGGNLSVSARATEITVIALPICSAASEPTLAHPLSAHE